MERLWTTCFVGQERLWPFAVALIALVGVAFAALSTVLPRSELTVYALLLFIAAALSLSANVSRLLSPVHRAKRAHDAAALLALLTSGRPRQRADAANALATLSGEPSLRPAIERALLGAATDADVHVRTQALFALAERGVAAARPLVFSALADRDPIVRVFGLSAAGRLRIGAAGPTVIRMLAEDRSGFVREHAALTLRDLRPLGAEAALERAARRDRDPDVRQVAREELEQLHAAA